MVNNSKTKVKPNSTLFLDVFNRIERYLRRITGESKSTRFSVLTERAAKSSTEVRYFRVDLKEFADLRNAIVHESTNGHVIAEPNDDTVRRIEYIASILLDPPRLIPLFQGDVVKLRLNDSVSNAVKLMLQKSFSQVPIYEDEKFMALLTTNTIARWLGSSVAADILSLSETLVSSILKFAEAQDNYCILNKNATVSEVLEKFHSHEKVGTRLDAILITQNGKSTEAPLGIITIWDLPRIYRMLEHSA